jgi:hypothetical protein
VNIQKDLVAWWRCDEGKGTTVADSSDRHHDGKIVDAVWKKDASGWALAFDGRGRMAVPFKPALGLPEGPFTLLALINPDRADREMTVIGNSTTEANPYRLWIGPWVNGMQIKSAFRIGDARTYFYGQGGTWLIQPNIWQQVVVTYDGKMLRQFVDGEEVASQPLDKAKLARVDPAELWIGNCANVEQPFYGKIKDVRLWQRGLDPKEITRLYLTGVGKERTIKQFTTILNRLSSLSKSRLAIIKNNLHVIGNEKEKVQTQLAALKGMDADTFEKQYEGISRILVESEKQISRLETQNAVLKKLPEPELNRVAAGDQSLVVMTAPPVRDERILPFAPVSEVVQYKQSINISACPGEFEPASFIVYPFREMALTIKAGDLKSSAGVIPAANVDIRVVKCWYQAGWAWFSIDQARSTRVLVPELLLHDDSLVKVDYEKQHNFLRMNYPTGDKYQCISKVEDREYPNEDFPIMRDLQVRDSPVLLPVQLPAGANKQFWITVKVPQDAKPGQYQGTITLASSAGKTQTLDLAINVLPFTLSEPKRFDLQDEYWSGIYYTSIIAVEGQLNRSHSRTPQQIRAELQNLKDHGVTNPQCCQLFGFYDLKYFRDMLQLRKEAGLKNNPLFVGSYWEGNVGGGEKADPESLKMVQTRVREIRQVVQEVLGHENIYFYGVDEATGDTLKAERPIWQAIHEAGGKVYVSGYHPAADDPKGTKAHIGLVGDLLDLLISAGPTYREDAVAWHALGHKVASYANPQCGCENPLIYRQNYGLGLWTLNFDGASDYGYCEALNNPYNDFDIATYRDIVMVYPAINGVIDTIAWEGYREGIDDIRYGTTLKLKIQAAQKSADPKKRALAREAESFLNHLDISKDLDAIRSKMIDYILSL